MTEQQVKEILNRLYINYPYAFRDINNENTRVAIVDNYNNFIGKYDFQDAWKGIEIHVLSDRGNNKPSMKELIECIEAAKKNRLVKEHKGNRRIVTPEEEIANTWKAILESKERSEYDMWFLQEHEDTYRLFYEDGWQERYKEHFGKYKEDFERIV